MLFGPIQAPVLELLEPLERQTRPNCPSRVPPHVGDHLFTVQAKLTALVQPVQAVNVVPAHLGGLAKGNIVVGDGHHGRVAVFGEGIPGGQPTLYLF